jgi:hypothetical protein
MSWKKALATVAPVLATALGSPLAGGAIKYLSNQLLGDESAPIEDLEQIINTASPEKLAEIKRLDDQYKLEMEKIGIDVFALEVKDRESARASHKDHPMPMVICLLLTLLVAIGAYGLMTIVVPEQNANIVFMLFGQIVTAWGSSIAYWVGTTKSSSDKTKLIRSSP